MVSTVSYFAGSAGTGFEAILKTVKKVNSFAALPLGWHYGTGGPASRSIIEKSLEYIAHFVSLGFSKTDAFAGEDGQVLVSAYMDEYCLEITIETDHSFTVSCDFQGSSKFFEPDLSEAVALNELRQLATEIVKEECATFVWSASNTTTTATVSSKALHLHRPATERRYSANNAASVQVARYASTLANTTRVLAESRPFFGFLNNRNLGLDAV